MKPVAYEGNEPFIFASYSHQDDEAVYEVLGELQKRGYRLWYDDGIEPGSEWPEYIARHLDAAAVVLAFVTPAAAQSPNCRREINYALSREKQLLAVMLKPTTMSPGMEMQLSTQQMIVRQNYSTWDRFIQKIQSHPRIERCRATARPTESVWGASARVPAPAAAPKPSAVPRPGTIPQQDVRPENATVVLDPEPAAAGGQARQNAYIAAPLSSNATVVLDPEEHAGPRAHNAQASAVPPTGTAWSAQRTATDPAAQTRAASPQPQNSAVQTPLNSTGTVWAGTSGQAAPIPGQAYQTTSWEASTPGQTHQAARPVGSDVPTSTPKPRGKRAGAVVAATAAAVVAVVALLFAFGPLHMPGGGGTHAGSFGPAASAHPDTMLETLVAGDKDDVISILGGLSEYQDEYGDYAFTTDSEAATFFTDIAPGWDDESVEQQRSFLESHADSLPWRVYTWKDNSSVNLDLVKNADDPPTYWSYAGYLNCTDPTSEDIATSVAEVFDYDGIVLYRLPVWGGGYRIVGRAFSEVAALEVNAYRDSNLEDYWSLQLGVINVKENWSQRILEDAVYLCEDESHRSSLEDAYVEVPDNGNAVYQEARDHFDLAAYEARLHGTADAIGSSFDVPFDLADLVGAPPEETANAIGDLEEFTYSGTYSDGDEWLDAYYTESEKMGCCMQLDQYSDDYDGSGWDYEKDRLDSAPWYITLYGNHETATQESIAGGADVERLHFYGMVPADDLTCEEIAQVAKEVYGFDQVILYADPESTTYEVEGYAKSGDTAARITGQRKTYDPIDAPNLGLYEIEIEVGADSYSGGWLNTFQETYHNAKLPERYPDFYKE